MDPYDEQPQLPRLLSDGVPYLIITSEGQQLSGRADISGKLPRVVTDGEAEYEVFWGDEALARMGADGVTDIAAGKGKNEHYAEFRLQTGCADYQVQRPLVGVQKRKPGETGVAIAPGQFTPHNNIIPIGAPIATNFGSGNPCSHCRP